MSENDAPLVGRMAYTCEVEIDVPRSVVLALMTDGDRAHEWMPGLASYECRQGERGMPGSVSELRFAAVPGAPEGGAVMTEQVERRDDAHYDVTYLVGPVRNENLNTFDELPASDASPAGRTRWVAEHVFLLPPGMLEGLGEQGQQGFRQNTQRSMETFRTWCEQAFRDAHGTDGARA